MSFKGKQLNHAIVAAVALVETGLAETWPACFKIFVIQLAILTNLAEQKGCLVVVNS